MLSALPVDMARLATEVSLPLPQVEAAVSLLDAGNTVPFITRYRKDATGGLDETQLRLIQRRLASLRAVVEKRNAIIKSLEARGVLTDELREKLALASSLKFLDDVYSPFRLKKTRFLEQARTLGLEPLAEAVYLQGLSAEDFDFEVGQSRGPDGQLLDREVVLRGVKSLLGEYFAQDLKLKHKLRRMAWKHGRLNCQQLPPSEADPEARVVGESGPTDPGSLPESLVGLPAGMDELKAETPLERGERPAADLESSECGTERLPLDQVAAITFSDTPREVDSPIDVDSFGQPAASTDWKAENVGDSVQEFVTIDSVNCQVIRESCVLPIDGGVSGADEEGLALCGQGLRSEEGSGEPEVAPRRKRRRKKKRRQDILYQDYFDFSEWVRKLPPHRVLAINRGERAKQLRVRVQFDEPVMLEQMWAEVVPGSHPQLSLVKEAARELLVRSWIPAFEREIRRELTEKAEEHAIHVFSTNLRSLLLQPPTPGVRVMALDPGLKSGCTLVVLDPFGNYVATDKISIVGREEKRRVACQKLSELARNYQVEVIAIGNGTGCREAEEVVSAFLSEETSATPLRYVIVNEAGASIYSTSDVGRNEFPDLEPTVRSAISIGRRLLDPLSELVKIHPANIGVGLYQHDVKAKHLEQSLAEIVESCVNYVGVDLNTASLDLLRYVAGLNQLTARRVIEYRQANGRFRSREQLLEVPGVGQATFVQCAGFLRIYGGTQPLDATAIHPESYAVAEALLASVAADPNQLTLLARDANDWTQRLQACPSESLASQFGVGQHLMEDVIEALRRPIRDPREALPAPIFRKEILQFDDLALGMQLKGQVLNVVDFGIFVDVGVGGSGLVHISNLSRDYVRDPHQYFGVGDVVDVWVKSLDRKRRRVSLTAIDPSVVPNGGDRTEVRQRAECQEPEVDDESQSLTMERGRAIDLRRDRSHQVGRAARPHALSSSEAVRNRAAGTSAVHSKSKSRSDRPSGSRGPRRGAESKPSKPSQRRPMRLPSRPLTDGMLEGTEPLRSFSDLLQYVKQSNQNKQDRQS